MNKKVDKKTIKKGLLPYLFILPYFKPAVNYPNRQNIFKNAGQKIYFYTKKQADQSLPVLK